MGGTSKYYEDTSRMLDDVEIEYLIDNDMFKQGKKKLVVRLFIYHLY